MLRRLALLEVISALGAFSTAPTTAGAGSFMAPHWLRVTEKQTLNRVFGGTHPVRTHYLRYPQKIAVVWEFKRVVACRLCSSPSGALAGGRVIRVSFDRQTHRLNGAMEFCEARGSTPNRALCLRR
jgi:hypothetical protein